MNKFFYGLLSLLFILTNPVFSAKDHDKLNNKSNIENTVTLKSGATYEIPKGFHAEKLDQTDEAFKVEDPEKALKIFLVETKGQDMSQAIDKAWKRVDPDFHAKITYKMESPTDYGINLVNGVTDAFFIQAYASDQANTMIQGKAERKGDTLWILLVSGPTPDTLKRDAQLKSLFGSLKVPGVVEEDLSQKPLTSITNNIDQLNEFIMKGMKELNIPGLSIAIVEAGKIVFEKGYGVTKWGGKEPVTPETPMKIGSISKSLTTLLMAKLIEEGKFGWHTKARALYPDFKVGDDKLSQILDMEQLVSMSTGIPNEDVLMVLHRLNPFQQLALIKPTTKNKETYQYNNQLFTVAGDIAAHAAEPNKPMDQAYTDLMEEKVFKPIGMNDTTFAPKKNYAFPHSTSLKGMVQVLTLQDGDFTDFEKPAGGIWSTAHDMALYMITELNKGVNSAGKRVFDKHNLMYRRTPQVQITHNSYYGLGWVVSKHKGLSQISHGGQTAGFAAWLDFFPEKQSGFVILTNRTEKGTLLYEVIDARILELWFGTNEKSSERLAFAEKEVKQHDEEIGKGWSEPNPEWMKPFLGKHKNDKLGIFDIKEDKGTYILDTGTYKTKLMTAGPNDEKVIVMSSQPLVGGTLIPTQNGSFRMVDGQHTYVFKKVE